MDQGRASGGRQSKTEAKKVFVKEAKKRDILLGKHKEAFNHPGNRSFRTLIGANWERYEGARGRSERTQIVVSIVKFLKEDQQVRFLKKDTDSGRWFEVHDSVAREKVGHAIRDAINFRKTYPNGRPTSRRNSSDTATASIKDGVQDLQLSEHNKLYEGSHKRPSPRPMKRQSKRAATASTIATLGPPLLEDSPMLTKPTLPSVSADDDSDEAIKMDVAGILGALKHGSGSPSVYSSRPMYSATPHNDNNHTTTNRPTGLARQHPTDRNLSEPPPSQQTTGSLAATPAVASPSILFSVPTTIRTPELMSQIAPSKSADSADSNGDIEIMLTDPSEGQQSHDMGTEQQAMLAAFTVWAAQNNIPTSKKSCG